MVYEWLAPAEPLADEDCARAVEYLDQQGRADLAVWVGYRLRAGGGVDHELVIRLRGRRPGSAERRALFWGVTLDLPTRCYVGFPTHAEMREARRVGERIWERTGPTPGGLDPLEFRLDYEPVELPADLRASIDQVGRECAAVRRIRLTRSKLLKSGRPVHESVNVSVACDGKTAGLGKGPVGALSDLLCPHFASLSIGMGEFPTEAKTTTVYVRSSTEIA
jgi:hypothetical protein